MKSIIYFIIVSLFVLSCNKQFKKAAKPHFDFTDTIRRTEVRKYAGGDSIIEYQVIIFTKNDFSVPIDSFYYEAESRGSKKGENYRIYFDRQKVIAYCDSMLNAIGPETLNNGGDLQMYNSILSHAQQGSTELVFVSETHYLMNRFRPLIVNPQTGHKPPFYFTTNRKSSEREDIEREFITQKGDTFGLSWENIWMAAIKIDSVK